MKVNPEKKEIDSACKLIFECLEMNSIPIHIATSACVKIILCVLKKSEFDEYQIDDFMNGFKNAYKAMKKP